jgi:NSS family neurotransmitter:Na+ symporter
MNQQNQSRETFGSRMGFIFAAAGSAIGIGNLWRFPWLAGVSGGGAFLLIYLLTVVIVGVSLFMCEIALGRYTQRSNVGAFRKIRPSWTWVGILGPLASFLTLCFYSVVGGWIIYYFFRAFGGFGGPDPAVTERVFSSFTGHAVWPIIFHGVFMGLTMMICYKGVKDGIERYSSIMMPLLLALILILTIRSLLLPGAAEGLRFYLVPDFSKITAKTFLDALGQVFFSLSLGVGSMLTYGSYLGKQENIPRISVIVPLMDTLVAFMAGLIIFPVVFSYGFEPGAGVGLTFVTLPAIFSQMPAGNLFGAVFFFLFFLAALTSTISALEAVVAYLAEEHGWERKRATVISGIVIFFIGCISSLSFGPLSGLTIAGLNFFGQLDWFVATLLQPLGGILTAIFVAWIWGGANALKEVTNGGAIQFRLGNVWANLMLKFIAPVLVTIVFLAGIGVI